MFIPYHCISLSHIVSFLPLPSFCEIWSFDPRFRWMLWNNIAPLIWLGCRRCRITALNVLISQWFSRWFMQRPAAVADPFWPGRIQERLHEEMEDCDALAVALEEALQKDQSNYSTVLMVLQSFCFMCLFNLYISKVRWQFLWHNAEVTCIESKAGIISHIFT